MTSDKKKGERYYLDRILRLLAPPLDGRIEAHEKQGYPDFLVTNGAGCLGIEVTELHRTHTGEGRQLEADQSMLQRVIDLAREIFDRSGYPPVHASVFFNIRF